MIIVTACRSRSLVQLLGCAQSICRTRCAKLSRSCWPAQQLFEATQGGAEFGGSAIGAECFEATGNSTPERAVISAPLGLDDRSYFDLGDKSGGAMEIDTSGRRVMDNSGRAPV